MPTLGDWRRRRRSRASRRRPRRRTSPSEPIGKGVWLLAGQSHHSVLVEFADHLMLIEAPQSEARTLAVIAKAKETVPNKPLTAARDHASSLRSHRRHARRDRRRPDRDHAGRQQGVGREHGAAAAHHPAGHAREERQRASTSRPSTAEREFKDQSMTVMLYHVAGNPHSDTMLMAYIPRDRILIEVDAFSPGSRGAIRTPRTCWRTSRSATCASTGSCPLHGAIAPFAELVKVAGAKDELMRATVFVIRLFVAVVVRLRAAQRRRPSRSSRSVGPGRQGRRVGAVAARHGQQADGAGARSRRPTS